MGLPFHHFEHCHFSKWIVLQVACLCLHTSTERPPVYPHTPSFLVESEAGNSFSLSYSLILIAGLKPDLTLLTHPLDNSHIHTPSSHFLFKSLIHSEISHFTHTSAPTVTLCPSSSHFGGEFCFDLITIGQGQVKPGPNCLQTTFSGGHCLLLTQYSSKVWVL